MKLFDVGPTTLGNPLGTWKVRKKLHAPCWIFFPVFWLPQNTFVLILDSNPRLSCEFREFAPSHIYCIQEMAHGIMILQFKRSKVCHLLALEYAGCCFHHQRVLQRMHWRLQGNFSGKNRAKNTNTSSDPGEDFAWTQKWRQSMHRSWQQHRNTNWYILTYFEPSSDVENLFSCVVCAHITTCILLASTQIRDPRVLFLNISFVPGCIGTF